MTLGSLRLASWCRSSMLIASSMFIGIVPQPPHLLGGMGRATRSPSTGAHFTTKTQRTRKGNQSACSWRLRGEIIEVDGLSPAFGVSPSCVPPIPLCGGASGADRPVPCPILLPQEIRPELVEAGAADLGHHGV